MTIIYEVNLFVERPIEADYRAWLKKHIAEILALPGFIGAENFDVPQETDTGHAAICVQYRLQSQAALNDYLEQHAPRLRAEGLAKFGGHFRATRRVLVST
jgi:antibiotic biosynthesis monooxygenase (ABM) superfamily enzyme